MTDEFGTAPQLPAIPPVSAGSGPAVVADALTRIKETLEVWAGARGDGLDKVITARDLLNSGLVNSESPPPVISSLIPRPGVIKAPPVPAQPAIPPTPTHLAASGAIGVIIVDWDFPVDSYIRLSHFELWRSQTDALGDAELIAQTAALVYSDEVGLDATYYYWVRAVSDADVSPFNAVAGTLGQTAPAFETVDDGENNGEPVTAGQYLKALYLKNGVIETAKMADLAVVDAKVANMSVSKLIAGSIAVGQYAQSTGYIPGSAGWRINGDGTAEFSEVVVRGTIFAAAGQIGGSTIGSNYIRSITYTLNEEGWNFNSDGTGQIGGLRIASQYIEANYAVGASGFRLTYDGQFLSKNFSIDAAGNATFSGALSAASGTFAGDLSAAGGTFSGDLVAAGGTFDGILTAQVVQTANIVGAAVTTTAVVTGEAVLTPITLSVPTLADDQALIIIVDSGASFSTGDEGTDPSSGVDYSVLTIDGVPQRKGRGTYIYTVTPVGTTVSISMTRTRYAITTTRQASIVALRTKR